MLHGSFQQQWNGMQKYSIHQNEEIYRTSVGNVILKIFDSLGRELATLVDEPKLTGHYFTEFNGTGLASGVYLARISFGNISDTQKIVLLK